MTNSFLIETVDTFETRHRRLGIAGCFAIALLSLTAVAGCAISVARYQVHDVKMGCDEVNRYAYTSMNSMRYTITSFVPAKTGVPGLIEGERDVDGRKKRGRVRLRCGPEGAAVEPADAGTIFPKIEFQRSFWLTFTSVAEQARARAQAASQGPAPSGVVVLVRPIAGFESQLDFGLDFTESALLPVRVSITNNSGRSCYFERDSIVLIREDGTRVRSLPVEDAIRQLSRPARDPNVLREKLLASKQTLHPDETVTGYLYYPLASYREARLLLVDVESDEAEGVVVQF